MQEDHENGLSEQFVHISHIIIGLRNSSQDWSSFGRYLTGKQSLANQLSSRKGKTDAADGETEVHINEITYCNWQ